MAPDLEILPGLGMIEIVLVLLSELGETETDVVEIEMSLMMTGSPPDTHPGRIETESGTESIPRRVAKLSRTARRKTKVFHCLLYIFFTSLD